MFSAVCFYRSFIYLSVFSNKWAPTCLFTEKDVICTWRLAALFSFPFICCWHLSSELACLYGYHTSLLRYVPVSYWHGLMFLSMDFIWGSWPLTVYSSLAIVICVSVKEKVS